VVGGVNGRNTHLCAAQSDQILDTGGFRHRMDGHAAAAAASPG
jgi:hypothetical protein